MNNLDSVEPKSTILVLGEILSERSRQDLKWGEQNHKLENYKLILDEEVGEVNIEVCKYFFAYGSKEKFKHLKNTRDELVQVAAVCVAMIESLDRNELKEIGQ